VRLGKHGTSASRQQFARVIAEWEAAGQHLVKDGSPTVDLSVNELGLSFWNHAHQHYRHPDGQPKNEINDFRIQVSYSDF
jgi:hypothetical protein